MDSLPPSRARRPLLVIEAPGKCERLDAFARAQGLTQARVVATGGRLFDLPDARLGVDPRHNTIKERVARDPARLRALQAAAVDADALWIMTDPDDEGHWIAEDVATEIARPGQRCWRAPLAGLDDAGIAAALNAAHPLDETRARPAQARRIFDRLTGYLYSDRDGQHPEAPAGTIGRVLTPTLAVMAEQTPALAQIVRRDLPVTDAEGAFEAVVSVPPDSAHRLDALTASLAELPAPTVVASGPPVHKRPQPWTGPEALYHCARTLQAPATEIADTLQHLYERGQITYPRTDSRALTAEQIQGVLQLGERLGRRGLTSAGLAAHQVTRLNDHGALLPLTAPAHPGLALASLDRAEQVKTLLTEQTLACATEGYVVTRTPGQPDERADRQAAIRWRQWAAQQGVEVSFVRGVRQAGAHRAPTPLSAREALAQPDGPTPARPVTAVRESRDLLALRVLHEQGLTRPSTLAHHAHTIGTRYLTRQGGLNRWARQSLQRAQILTPALCSVEKVYAINAALVSRQAGPAAERVERAFSLAGLRPHERSESTAPAPAPEL